MKKKVMYLSLLTMVVLSIIIIPINIKFKKAKVYESIVVVPDIDSYKTLTLEDIATNQINESVAKKKTTYEFYASMFGIDYDTLINEIRNNNKTSFNELDLLQTGSNKASFDASLLEFVTNLESQKSELFKRDYVYKNCSKDYIYNLIEYFVSLNPSVDVQTAKAITWIETGNLAAQSMLNKNNIFGGMSNGRLTSYPSIEYGVYKYISLLRSSYFDQGLRTVEQIGYKYNPTVVDGVKMANPTWVSNVNAYRNKFSSSVTIDTVEKLLNM